MMKDNSQNIEKQAALAESKVHSTGGDLGEAVIIRQAVKEDCERIMELIKELSIYEKEPDAVTVDFNHFVESGFGEKPVWWAFVAETAPKLVGKQKKNNKQSVFPSSKFPPPSGFADRGTNVVQEGAERQVEGFALFYIRYSTWKGQRLYLEDLIVTDKMRGKGIGKLLLDRLVQECKDKKYSGMMWQVLDWNEPAINFYKKYGGVNFDGEWVNCSVEVK